MVVAVIALGGGVLLLASGGLGRVAAAIGSTFTGLVTDLTSTPVPSAAPITVSDAPILEAPDEPYTNQPAVDLAGTVPADVVGQAGAVIRIYVAIGDGAMGPVKDVAVGPTPRFLVPGVPLSAGTNTFTATIIGPTDLESEPSATIAWVLDLSKPKLTITAPTNNALVNATSVKLEGTTQGRTQLSAHNLTTNATVAGAADNKGRFGLLLPIGNGANKIEITATDPAGNVNTARLSVRRGSGVLTARVSASFYQVRLNKLPEPVQLTASVTDPDGKPVVDAEVTFTVAVKGVPAIASSALKTGSNGRASFTTTIPKGAEVGQISVTVTVRTSQFGDVTDRTVITIAK
jgi:Glucodextranase, domain B